MILYMIKIENFDNIEVSGITYGGHSGSKSWIVICNSSDMSEELMKGKTIGKSLEL